MKLKLIILFSLIALISNAQLTTDIEYKLKSTGNAFGKLLKLELKNNSSQEINFEVYPFYLPSEKGYSGIIVPKGKLIKIKANEEKTVEFDAYSTHISKKVKPPVNYLFSNFKLEKVIATRPDGYDKIITALQEFNIQNMNISELIPFDYVLTHPGTHGYLTYKFNLDQNQKLATSILMEQANKLENGYDRLHLAGKLVTHFNQDIDFEKAFLVQSGMWICGSGLEGNPLKKAQLKKIIAEVYQNFPDDIDLPHFKSSWSRYENIFERLGAESRVFITPEELDLSPKCLPEIVGYKATSKAVRIPSVTSKRYEVYNVRNQKFDVENDCLPCKTNLDKNSIILSWLSSKVITNALSVNLADLKTMYHDNKYSVYFKNIENLRLYDGPEFLKNKEVEKSERMEMAKTYFSNLTNAVSNTKTISTPTISLLQNQFIETSHLLNHLLFLFSNETWQYTLDCCYSTRQPNQMHADFAESILINLDKLNRIKLLDFSKSENTIAAFEEQYWYNANLAVIEALLNVFRSFAPNKQLVCIEEKLEHIELAPVLIQKELGFELILEGKYIDGRYMVEINEKDMLQFKFNSCNCGKYRESTIKFLPLSQGTSFDKVSGATIKSRSVEPKLEASLSIGTLFAAPEGLDQYNGNGIQAIKDVIKANGFDTSFENSFSKNYSFSAPTDFSYENVLDFRLGVAYEVIQNTHIRLAGSYSKGFVEGNLPINYLENPVNPNSQIVYNALLRSELEIFSFGGGFRYYFGNKLKPFVGAGFSYVMYHNEYAKLYTPNFEMEIEEFADHSNYNITADFGLRYKVNQDMFLDFTYLLINRNDRNAKTEKISVLDHGINIGIGTKF